MGGTGCGENWVLFWWAGPCSVSLNPITADGGAVFPPCSLSSGGRGNGNDGYLHQKDLCKHAMAPRTVLVSVTSSAAGHCQLMPPPETSKHTKASVAQSLRGSPLLSPVSWCTQGFLSPLKESVFPVLWKFCNQIPLTLKVRFPGDPRCLFLIPRLGSLM